MFRIKICGVTRPKDASAAAEAGADAIGLNFFPESKRFVSLQRAAEIATEASDRDGFIVVGVFVNADTQQISSTCDAVGLHAIQLHGDEPPDFLAELRQRDEDMAVIRAFRLGARGITAVNDYLNACSRLDCLPNMVLLDAARPGQFGGTGECCDWNEAAKYHELADAPPLVLAGGLNADNVAEAVRAVRPVAVDTASGVETAPGVKDVEQINRFVAAAKKEFGAAG